MWTKCFHSEKKTNQPTKHIDSHFTTTTKRRGRWKNATSSYNSNTGFSIPIQFNQSNLVCIATSIVYTLPFRDWDAVQTRELIGAGMEMETMKSKINSNRCVRYTWILVSYLYTFNTNNSQYEVEIEISTSISE